MKKLIILSLFILLGLPSTFARADLNEILPKLEQYVDVSMAQWGAPGVVVIIVKDGKVVHQRAYGTSKLNDSKPITPDMLFPLASLTKNFTGHVVARLVDQGKLKWDDRVLDHLPNFALRDPEITQIITIRDLMSHRSGLHDFSCDSLMEKGWPQDEIIASLPLIPIPNKFRESFDYQNVMVGVVGLIMQRATGKTLEQIYQDELFGPLGLEDSTITNPYPQELGWWGRLKAWFKGGKTHIVTPLHDHLDGKTRMLPNGNPGLYVWPASTGLNASPRDLAKWLLFVTNNAQTLVSPEQIKVMRTMQVDCGPPRGGRQFPKERVTYTHYGIGWFIHDYAGVPMLAHLGGMNGTRSLITIIPEEKVGIIVVSNYGGMRVSLLPEAIRSKFLDLYLELDDVDWSTKLHEQMVDGWDKIEKTRLLTKLNSHHPMRDFDFYEGVYENELYGRINIEKQGKSLVIRYRNLTPCVLTHLSDDRFTYSPTTMSISYAGVDAGDAIFGGKRSDKATHFWANIFHEGVDPLFKRVE